MQRLRQYTTFLLLPKSKLRRPQCNVLEPVENLSCELNADHRDNRYGAGLSDVSFLDVPTVEHGASSNNILTK
jgi:hypothetical protein